MGTTAQKLEYLGTTKSQLKDMINYGLDDNNKITNSTTFRNYVSSIFNAFLEALRNPDTLFTNLPKKSGTGAVISLNGTANAPMRIELGASELTQDGTPTPSSPQEIHTISGSNKVKVRGKNLFNKNSTIDNKEIQNGIIVNSNGWCVSDYIPIEYNQTYVKNTNEGNSVILYDKNYNVISTNVRFTNNKLTITESNAKYLLVNLPMSIKDTYQLEIGTTATTYEPYISQEAEINLGGTNLLNNWFRFADGTYYGVVLKNNNNGSFTISGTATATGNITCSISNSEIINKGIKLPIGTYTQKTATRFQLVDASGNWKQNTWETFTTSEELYVNNMFISIASGTTYNNTYWYMLNEGNTAKDYVPYVNPIEYCKIGNYEDKIFKNIPAFSEYDNNLIEGEWYIKKNIGKVVLDGTENWAKQDTWSSVGDKTNAFYIGKPTDLDAYHSCYCDYLKYVIASNIITTDDYGISYSASLILRMPKSLTDANALKTWLASNNVSVYYVLATPTYTQITGTLETQLENVYQKLLSYSGTTNISQINNDLGFVMSVSAIEE